MKETLILVPFAILVFSPGVMIILDRGWGANEVISTRPVGELVNSYPAGGDWVRGPQIRVQTTIGIFYVRGAFQGLLGTAVTLEERGNGDRVLCTADPPSCNWM